MPNQICLCLPYICALVLINPIAAFSLSCFGRKSPCSLTALHVSELHIPGYAQTKLPFILKDSDLEEESEEGVVTLTKLEEKLFTEEDYDSLLPHEEGNLIHKTKEAIFSKEECERIVDEADRYGVDMGWTTNRHGNYPTTDIPIVELPDTLKFFRRSLAERIYPLLRAQFGEFLPDGKRLMVADGFIVKYDAEGGQKELKPHRDGSVVSFNIALNPAADFEGGGTWFASLEDAIKIDQGEIVTHASGVLHGGHGITIGKRYIMVCFVILEGYDSWSMRFYNKVRNE